MFVYRSFILLTALTAAAGSRDLVEITRECDAEVPTRCIVYVSETPSPPPTDGSCPIRTDRPTQSPTAKESSSPTSNPSAPPSKNPTSNPSATPTNSPSNNPSATPSSNPSATPTSTPTGQGERSPSETPSNSPSAEPEEEECIGSDYSCSMPSYLSDYSLITKGDAAQAAKVVYSGIAVGGTLSDPNPQTSIVVNGKSYVFKLGTVGNINWNGGGVTYGKTLEEAGIDFTFFEWLAKNLEGSSNGNYKVVIVTEGGTFDTNDFNYDGQGEDNGHTLAVFNTDEDIILTKTHHGRQFGPSILAPFSHVKVLGDAGYVDGVVIAKTFETAGNNPSNLQLHGDQYKGSVTCKATPVCL